MEPLKMVAPRYGKQNYKCNDCGRQHLDCETVHCGEALSVVGFPPVVGTVEGGYGDGAYKVRRRPPHTAPQETSPPPLNIVTGSLD